MLCYFTGGPYINLFLLNYQVLPSLLAASPGAALTMLVIARPSWFRVLSALFAGYGMLILYLTV